MTAYIVLTAMLMNIACCISIATYVIRRDNPALVRGLGEFAIALWGAYLVLH